MVKPIAVPPRPIPYHLKARVDNVIESMIMKGIIEEHPPNKAAPWVSCTVIVPKSESFLCITLNAHNLNKALISSNYPIPHQEDIRAQLSGTNYFCKLDFKSAFWQLEIETESQALTVFHANNKLYHYTRLIMGVKPAQDELNAALKLIFSHIPNVYLIHDNLIIANKSTEEHLEAIHKAMEVIKSKNLTFNPTNILLAQRK